MIEILLLILFFIASLLLMPFRTSTSFSDMYRDMISDIVRRSNLQCPDFIIRERMTHGNSYTLFKSGSLPIIYILTTNQRRQRYSEDTIRLAIIHELAHIIYGGKEHPPEFVRVEALLRDTAIQRGYIRDSSYVDPSYPCVPSHI
jgi:hypothetical protein